MEQKAKEVVARCKNLPTIPAVALEVLRLSRAENVDLREIAGVIVHDVALSGRLLSVVNSAFYGFPRKVSTVGQAVVMLGLSSVKALALGFSLALNIKQNSGAPYQSFWRRSLVMAVAARTFAEHKIPTLREEAFTAGLLADMGVLAMGEAFGEAYKPFAAALAQGHSEIFVLEAERRQFGTDHQEVAFFMADAWHLPELLTISVAHHHEPDKCGDVEPTIAALAGVLYAADLCAETFCGPPSVTVVESFERAAQQYVGVDQAACREMVAKLNSNVQEIAKLLEIEISGSSTSYAEIVQQANVELTRLTLASQQESHTIGQRHREAASRVQKLEESNQQLSQKANTDALTGLYNRRFMEDLLKRDIVRARRFGTPLSVLFLDLDRFKSVNDQYGHGAGDQVLRQMGELLRSATREADCVCRYGGEEFVLSLPETDLLGAKQLAETLRQVVEEWEFDVGASHQLKLTVSIGVATLNPSRPIALDKGQLIAMADKSVYAAKKAGRNCVFALGKRIVAEPDSAAE